MTLTTVRTNKSSASSSLPYLAEHPEDYSHRPIPITLYDIPISDTIDVRLEFESVESDLAAGRMQQALSRLRALRMLICDTSEPATEGKFFRGGMTPRQKRRTEAYIEERLGTSLTVAHLAEIATLSCSHFCRTFRESFGQPPQAYLQGRRVERAKRLMLTTDDPIAAIAIDCGFADQAALCKVFRRLTGESPAAWRRLRRD